MRGILTTLRTTYTYLCCAGAARALRLWGINIYWLPQRRANIFESNLTRAARAHRSIGNRCVCVYVFIEFVISIFDAARYYRSACFETQTSTLSRSCLLQNKINMIARDAEMSLCVHVCGSARWERKHAAVPEEMESDCPVREREAFRPYTHPPSAPGLF